MKSTSKYGIYFDTKFLDNPKYPELNGSKEDNETFIVAMDNKPDKTGHITKCYHRFPSIADYNMWFKTVPEADRCFYEVIPEHAVQRIFFDIEQNYDDSVPDDTFNLVVAAMVSSINAVLVEHGNKSLNVGKDIVICDSSSSTKFSIHLILNNYYVHSIHENKRFAKFVHSKLDPSIQSMVDMSVYNKNRCFRLLGCRKRQIAPNAPLKPKKQLSGFTYDGVYYPAYSGLEYQQLYITIVRDESFISGMSKQIQFSADAADAPEVKRYRPRDCKYDDVITKIDSEEKMATYLSLVKRRISEHLGVDISSKTSPLQFDCIRNNGISIRRVKSTYCKQCKRNHDHIDGFGYTYIGKRSVVYLNYTCNRNETHTKLGKIGVIKMSYDSESDTLSETIVF